MLFSLIVPQEFIGVRGRGCWARMPALYSAKQNRKYSLQTIGWL